MRLQQPTTLDDAIKIASAWEVAWLEISFSRRRHCYVDIWNGFVNSSMLISPPPVLNAIPQPMQSMPMIPTQPNSDLVSSGNQLEVESSIQKEKKWDMLTDQIERWLNTMSIHMQEQQRQGQIEEACDMQQEAYPMDQNVNLPIQEPYETIIRIIMEIPIIWL